MDYTPVVVGVALVIVFLGAGVSIPFILFQRNRDDARAWNEVIQAYTGLRTQLIEENARLAAMVDELSADVEKLSDKLDDERSQRLALQEQFQLETMSHRNCIREIDRLRSLVEGYKKQNDAWMRWYMLVLEQFTNLDITPPPDAPAGPVLRDGE